MFGNLANMGLAFIITLTIIATSRQGILAGEVCYHEYNIGCFKDNAPGNALPQSPAHMQVKSGSVQASNLYKLMFRAEDSYTFKFVHMIYIQ